MPRLIKNFIARLKLFSPVFIEIGISILIITWQSINSSNATIQESLKETISIEPEIITKMFEHKKELKLSKNTSNLVLFAIKKRFNINLSSTPEFTDKFGKIFFSFFSFLNVIFFDVNLPISYS
jgi:hypothetical protein